MIKSPQMMRRRLREGVEFFNSCAGPEMAAEELIVCADDSASTLPS